MMNYAISLSDDDMPLPYGIMVDGIVYNLDGQPPLASSKGWGYLGWARQA